MNAWTEAPTLAGYGFRVRPLSIADAQSLLAICPTDCFKYYVSIQPRVFDDRGFTDYLQQRLDAPAMQSFTLETEDGRVIGESALMDMRESWRCLEIGMTWIAPHERGGRANPAVKLLMLTHAFETLGCVRVSLKTDGRNLHSQAAIEKLGAKREGTLRKFGIQPNGFQRDTVYFSILDEEWPSVRDGLLRRLNA